MAKKQAHVHVVLHFRDTTTTLKTIRERAAAEERSVSDYVRRLLRRALAAESKP